ncbi:hypothetical protein [Brevibacillus sp. H7]|uniref:hypothetical protein n=1 Tax=Brevibacillus sp. H7 TaxID=3349138 RepID=UPI0038163EF5
MRTEALNGLKKGDRVAHVKRNRSAWKHLNNGLVTDVFLSGKSVYVKWFDDNGKSSHWVPYNCDAVEKIE